MDSNASDHFIEELERVITRFRQEYDLTYAEAIGCLELVKFDLVAEMRDEQEDST